MLKLWVGGMSMVALVGSMCASASELDDPNSVQDFLQICAERELSRPLLQ